ncbi:MAG TPA: hypothetical protein PLS50_07110, partial [Candidatus Dojkabacteria bacterium]|nr:hypothetical protein [Candidatus Dojkabacteria bacterium]
MLTLSEFDMLLKWKPGKQIPQADALSRIVINPIINKHIQSQVDQFQLRQLQDAELSEIMEELEDKRLTKKIEEFKYQILDGILVVPNKDKKPLSIEFLRVIPKSLQKYYVEQAHINNSHCGIDATAKILAQSFYWDGLYKSVKEFISKCSCQGDRKLKPVGQLHVVESPFVLELVEVDITYMPETSDGHKYLTTVRDHYSGYTWAWPQRSKQAS